MPASPGISASRKLRVAIVGAGRMGRWHALAVRSANSELVAIADTEEGRARELARSLRVSTTVTDAATILQHGRLDVVHVCTPPTTHVGLIHQAIDAGIHVLAEKPLAMTAGDTEQLADLATRNGVILCPVHQMSFQDGAIRATTDLPSIGDVSAIALRVFSAGGTGQALSALDQLVSEILPHPLSIVGAFWPNAGLNTARWSIHSSAPGELLVGGEHGGALLSIHISLSGRPPCFEMNIAGERGSIAIDFLHGYSIRFNGSVSRQQKILQPFKIGLAQFGAASANLAKRALRGESAYPGLRLLVGRFYAAVRGESASPISLQDTLLVAIAREAIQTALIQRQAGIASVPGNQSTFDEMARRDF